eukprot:CAMPEP_0175172832 /NCGR_PEP_ID=MMETSP0087-20121206/31682_1 /TAXON_ID=136419 /ORGANISM="Unknown Unknown, Strain D1" /LENGTH=102 /DNA_ID=CAMNT_0016464007 /DNA_START=32 /DNA_END=340 /DNA_ORIENTATION=+
MCQELAVLSGQGKVDSTPAKLVSLQQQQRDGVVAFQERQHVRAGVREESPFAQEQVLIDNVVDRQGTEQARHFQGGDERESGTFVDTQADCFEVLWWDLTLQ